MYDRERTAILATKYGPLELHAINAERVRVEFGQPVNIDPAPAMLEVRGVAYHGSALLFSGAERGDNAGGGFDWTTFHPYEHNGYTNRGDNLHLTRADAYSGPGRAKETSEAAKRDVRAAIESAVSEWAATDEGRQALERAQQEWTAAELRSGRDGLRSAYSSENTAWDGLSKAWERYQEAAARAGELERELEPEAQRIADLIEDGDTPDVLALAVLVALTVKQRADRGAYPTTEEAAATNPFKTRGRRQVGASS